MSMCKHKIYWVSIALLFLVGCVFGAYQVYTVHRAHTTFDRYYAFRGCAQLIDKTDTYGDCRLADGSVIKIVLNNDKWYLDGDGPGIW